MTTTPPSPSTSSPPAKRLKSSVAVPDVIKTTEFTEINEAPIKSEFLPDTNGHTEIIPKEPSASGSSSKPQFNGKPQKKKNRKIKRTLPEKYSSADVTFHDVRDFIGADVVDEIIARKDGSEWEVPKGLELFEEVELDVGAFTVSGESISLYPTSDSSTKPWTIITPFAHPGDKIRAKIYKHDRLTSYADLVEIIEYSEEHRGGEGDRRKYPEGGCKYFGECGGCQLQPVPYPLQLLHKKRTVQLAYQRFSDLPSSALPAIQPTIGSPKQWAYRTKITPHFDAPPKWFQKQMKEKKVTEEGEMNSVDTSEEVRGWETRIGFERKGRPGVLDIEECPIATPVLNLKLTEERKRVQDTILSFTRGATILLRDSLPPPDPLPTSETPFQPSAESDAEEEKHVAITNHKLNVYEKVGKYIFSFSAGSFFQNNNSILIPLTDYVKEAIFPPSLEGKEGVKVPTHLVDTYCGSGLFGITLSERFERVAGVEISHESIAAAKKNAEMNGLGGKTTWLCGKAEDIFGGLSEKGFEGERSCVVVDPPRKGCDEPFLTQLLSFKPLTIVYVSCNVHTQARDVGYLIRESEKRGEGKGWKYMVESLRGFDLFPQTAHVESVAVLRLVEN